MGKSKITAPKPGAWLIREEWLERIKAAMMSASVMEASSTQIESFKPLSETNKIAVISITGVLYRYADEAWWNGGISVEEISNALTEALTDDSYQGILLRINSPGGQADGISELAGNIRAAATKKPIIAYIDGDACSGAIWLASAASRVVINEIGWAGSIGAFYLFYDMTKFMDDVGIKEIVVLSSLSPNKNPDPATEEGYAQYLAQIDALTGIFVASVAKYRGTTPEDVLANYGQGAVFMGQQAVDAGLADELGTFDTALALVGAEISTALSRSISMLSVEQIRAENPDAAKALINEGYKAGCAAERVRIKGIDELDLTGEDRTLMQAAKDDGISTAADVAVRVLAAQKERRAKLGSDRASDAAALADAAGAAAETSAKSDAELAKEEGAKIAAAAKSGKGAK
jgi:signal peptide peptidase SppA